MDDCHAFYLWQEILRAIIGSVDTAQTNYEADCLDWQSVIDDGHKLLCQADMLQFKEFAITTTCSMGMSMINMKNGHK